MITNPKIGQWVQVRYAEKKWPATLPHLQHRRGVVVTRGTGKPRNHGVYIAGTGYVIPCGNLFKLEVTA